MCFSILWLVQLLVWLVVIGALVAILRLLLPWALSFFGEVSGLIIQIVKIIIAAVIIIAVIWFCYDIITCVGFGYPRMR